MYSILQPSAHVLWVYMERDGHHRCGLLGFNKRSDRLVVSHQMGVVRNLPHGG